MICRPDLPRALSHFATFRDESECFFALYLSQVVTHWACQNRKGYFQMQDLNIRTRALTSSEYKARLNARYNPPAMSQNDTAARLYIGRKQAEKAARVDSYFLAAWAVLFFGAICAPFFIIWGV